MTEVSQETKDFAQLLVEKIFTPSFQKKFGKLLKIFYLRELREIQFWSSIND